MLEKYIAGNRNAWNTASQYHFKAMGDKWLEAFKTPGRTCFYLFCDFLTQLYYNTEYLEGALRYSLHSESYRS